MIAAPALIPANPLGANPPCAGLVQLSGRTKKAPTAIKKRMIPTLRSTMALLVLADCRIPITRMTVMTATERKAGRFAMTGRPNRTGAVVRADARYWLLASVAPWATAAAAIWADRGSGASHAGRAHPEWLTSSRKYPDHPNATPMFPTAYSMMRSH